MGRRGTRCRTARRVLDLGVRLFLPPPSLAHDLGHTCFGHSGEEVLDHLTGHFAHNEQSLRVVDVLERKGKKLPEGKEVKRIRLRELSNVPRVIRNEDDLDKTLKGIETAVKDILEDDKEVELD